MHKSSMRHQHPNRCRGVTAGKPVGLLPLRLYHGPITRIKASNELTQPFHIAQAGESLSDIARRYNMTPHELKVLNFGKHAVLKGDHVAPGKQLVVSNRQASPAVLVPTTGTVPLYVSLAVPCAAGLLAATAAWHVLTKRKPEALHGELELITTQAEELVDQVHEAALTSQTIGTTSLLQEAHDVVKAAEAQLADVAALRGRLLQLQQERAAQIAQLKAQQQKQAHVLKAQQVATISAPTFHTPATAATRSIATVEHMGDGDSPSTTAISVTEAVTDGAASLHVGGGSSEVPVAGDNKNMAGAIAFLQKAWEQSGSDNTKGNNKNIKDIDSTSQAIIATPPIAPPDDKSKNAAVIIPPVVLKAEELQGSGSPEQKPQEANVAGAILQQLNDNSAPATFSVVSPEAITAQAEGEKTGEVHGEIVGNVRAQPGAEPAVTSLVIMAQNMQAGVVLAPNKDVTPNTRLLVEQPVSQPGSVLQAVASSATAETANQRIADNIVEDQTSLTAGSKNDSGAEECVTIDVQASAVQWEVMPVVVEDKNNTVQDGSLAALQQAKETGRHVQAAETAKVPHAPTQLLPQQDTPSNADSVQSLKSRLLECLYATTRGLTADSETRATVEELVAGLECRNPNTRPTECMDILAGRWKLVYTSSPATLLLLSALDALPICDLGDVYQVIDTTTMTAYNQINIKAPMQLSLHADTRLEVRNPRALQVRIMRIGMDAFIETPELLAALELPKSINLWGAEIDLSPIRNLILEPLSATMETSAALLQRAMSPDMDVKGLGEATNVWMVTTYLEESLRITRDDIGRINVLLKDDGEAL